MAKKLRPSELSFETLCNFLESISLDNMEGWKNKFDRRREHIEAFLNQCIDRGSGEAFDVFRLVLPNIDTDRGNYHLKEAALARMLAKGLTIDETQAGQALLKWKDPGIGAGAGDLSAVVEKAMHEHARFKADASMKERKTLKVGVINEKLDELVKLASLHTQAGDDDKKRKEDKFSKQKNVLNFLFRRVTPRQSKWLIQIILKNMKHKCGEGPIFRAWHPDAQAYYDSHGMSLRAVFNDLKDPFKPGTTDIIPGKVANPQLASTTVSSEIAVAKLLAYEKERYGSEGATASVKDIPLSFVIETKFDGERIQVHRCGNTVKYISRNAIDHGVKSRYTVLDDVVLAATGGRLTEEELKDEKKNGAGSKYDCVLDGEMIVWNKRLQAFEPFGTIKNTCNAAVAGVPSTTVVDTEELNPYKSSNANFLSPILKDLELMYIPFDILYCSGQARIKQPLSERQRLLKETVKPTSLQVPGSSGICVRVEPIIPEETKFGGQIASKRATTEEEIKIAVENARQRKEEGIVIKALSSQWIPNNRGRHWLKIKPDYLYNLEIDAVILGGWYSTSSASSRKGVTQYLMGLVAPPSVEGAQPTQFITFCRVGSGLDEEERKDVDDKLNHLYVADPSAKPSCVVATNSTNGRPDVWVRDPFKSLVLQIHADLRFIPSDQFASKVSLRFPRISNIRYDKDAVSANREDTFLQDMKEKMDEIAERDAAGVTPGGKKRRKQRTGASSKRRKVGLVLAHVRKQAEKIAAVEVKTDIFKGRKIYIFPLPVGRSLTKNGSASASGSAGAGVKGNLAKWRAAVKELGGVPPLNFTPSVTDVVAATLDDPKVKDFIKSHPERSILSPGWILRCQEHGMLCPLRPQDFLYQSSEDLKKLSSSGDIDKFGDSYFDDVELEDVEALVQRHIRKENISVEGVLRSLRAAAAPLLLDLPNPPSAAGGASQKHPVSDEDGTGTVFANGLTSLNKLEEYLTRAEQQQQHHQQQQRRITSPRLLLGWMESELAAVGKLDYRRSILHGCTLFILEIPMGSKKENKEERKNIFLLTGTKQVEAEAAEAVATAQRLATAKVRLTAQMLGAKVVSELNSDVTHVVGIISAPPESSDLEKKNTASDVEISAAAVLSPDPDNLLAALKNSSSTEGNNAVHVLEQPLLHSTTETGSIQLVSSDWVEEAAAVAAAAAAAAEEKSSIDLDDDSKVEVSLPEPPHATQFPLMDAAFMDDLSSWPWRKYKASPPAAGGGKAGAKEKEKKRGRPKGRSGAITTDDDEYKPVPGEILHVPATRRGTAIQKRGKAIRTAPQVKKEDDEEESFDDDIGSIADSELEDIPKIKSKPRNNRKKTTAPVAVVAKEVKKEEDIADENVYFLAPVPPSTHHTAPVSAPDTAIPTPAAVGIDDDDDGIMSFKELFDMMPQGDFYKKKDEAPAVAPAPAPAPPPAVGRVALDASAASGSGGNNDDLRGVHTTLPTMKPETESLPPPPAAASPLAEGGSRPKLSLKEKIRQMKEAKERAEAAGGKI